MTRNLHLTALAAAVSLAGLAGTGAAQEASAHRSATASISAAARVGAIAPQPFSKLGSFAVAGVEAGYIIPAVDRRIQVGAAFLYSRPPASGGGNDSRLSGGTYHWSLDQQMFIYEVDAIYRLFPPGETVVPFARLGGRIYTLQTSLNGNSGDMATFGEHTEGKTEVGMVIGAGADWTLGPGALVGELDLGFSNMNERLTGDSNTGAFELSAGYRFFF